LKVLYVVSTLKRCGPTNQLYGIVKHLDRKLFTPVVLTLSPEGKDSRWQDFVALGIDVRTLGLGRLAGVFRGGAALREHIASIAPDVLHTQGIRADSLCMRLFGGNIPQVATLRNYPFKDYVMSYGALQGGLMARWHLHHLGQVPVVALVSHAIHGMLGGSLKRARVVQNGVDVDRYHVVNSTERGFLRERLGLPRDARIFISTGHLDPRKDPITVLDGFLSGA
jgi:glycosyltransferase involved in cell wall biosynthesis